eukprot:m.28699 g.28699  ORF g.28699 m.28699 type:complete len:334 (-) comp6584_c0_seq1:2860-3861(-)
MMEDANGYNMIYAPMMLVWPEITATQRRDLYVPDVVELLENFKYYIAPDGQMFQFNSGLSAHYSSILWAATFERGAQLSGDASFRYAASQMLSSMQRQNISLMDSIVAIDQGSAWTVAFGLLCGARESDTRLVRGCGPGWATESTPITPPSTVREPSAAVRYRREPAAPIWEGRVPDKVVMSQSREFGSNGTFFTMAAHTGRSLFHSHSIDTTAGTNFWQGGAQYLGPSGKHDSSANHANHVILQRNTVMQNKHFPAADCLRYVYPWRVGLRDASHNYPTSNARHGIAGVPAAEFFGARIFVRQLAQRDCHTSDSANRASPSFIQRVIHCSNS